MQTNSKQFGKTTDTLHKLIEAMGGKGTIKVTSPDVEEMESILRGFVEILEHAPVSGPTITKLVARAKQALAANPRADGGTTDAP